MANLSQVNSRIKSLTGQLQTWSETSLQQNERALARAYKAAFKQIDGEINAIYQKYANSAGVLTAGEMNKYSRLTRLQKEIQDQLKLFTGKMISSTNSELYKQFRGTYYGTGYSFESTLGVNLGFTQINHAAMLASTNKHYQFKTWHDSFKNSSTKLYDNVKGAISTGMAQGSSHTQMAREIQKYFNNGYNDAVRIVRTEQLRANSVAQLDAQMQAMKANTLQDQGLDMIPFWIASLDGRTRTDHSQEDGKNPDAKGFYYLGATRTKAPGLSGVKNQDINCRCLIGTSFEGIKGKEELTRNARYNDIGRGTQKPYKTYPDWLKKKGIKNSPLPKVKSAPKIGANKSGSFVPAKTIAEANKRGSAAINGKPVSLKGLPMNLANGVLQGIEREAAFGSMNGLQGIKTVRNSRGGFAGVYQPGNKTIGINLYGMKHYDFHPQELVPYPKKLKLLEDNKKLWQEHLENLESQGKTYGLKKNWPSFIKREIKTTRGYVNRTSEDIRKLKEDINKGLTPRHYTTSSSRLTPDQRIQNTTVHEIGHFRNDVQIPDQWFWNTGRNPSWFKPELSPSEYGRSNPTEYFAEWYAEYRAKGAAGVPQEMLIMFEQIGKE